MRVLLVDDHPVVREGLRALLTSQEDIEVDVVNLEIGDSLHLSELTVPDGVDVVALSQETEQDQPVVSVQPPQKVVEEAELEAGEEEGLEVVEGAEPEEKEETS